MAGEIELGYRRSRHKGRRAEAFEPVAPAYGWFTAGLETATLEDARTLFDDLT